jgi:hypothetical protein
MCLVTLVCGGGARRTGTGTPTAVSLVLESVTHEGQVEALEAMKRQEEFFMSLSQSDSAQDWGLWLKVGPGLTAAHCHSACSQKLPQGPI